MKFGVQLKVQHLFLDSVKVQAVMDKQTVKALNRIGGTIRLIARRSIRKRKKSSQPGSPPSSHTNNSVVSLKNILYHADLNNSTVIIGPVLLNARSDSTVPQVLEFGGRQAISEKQVRGKWMTGKARRGEPSRVRTVRYDKRPFMRPALLTAVEKGTLPKEWKLT